MNATPGDLAPVVPVVLVHRDPKVRQHCEDALRVHPDIRVLASLSSGREGLAAAQLSPGLVPGLVVFIEAAQVAVNGADELSELRAATQGGAVALLTAQQADDDLLALLIAGARGYLDPDAHAHWLPKATHALAAGEAWVPRRVVARLLDLLVAPHQAPARVASA